MKLSRRTLLQSAVASAALTSASCVKSEQQAEQDFLQYITEEMLNAYPETATSAGVDVGKYAELKSKLTDRSIDGQRKIAQNVRETLAKLKQIDTSALSDDDANNIDVMRTVYETAVEGFEFSYGDVALLNTNWSYRNTPYVVAQNVGAFVEIPSLLDSSHQIANAEDAEAYLSRMEAYARQIEGEAERVKADGAAGVVLPDFLIAKTIGQMKTALATPVEQWGIVSSLVSRGRPFDAKFAERAVQIAETSIKPALALQMETLEVLAPQANSNAGVWDLPDGEAYYAWALKASTTTTMTPDEVHEMGQQELAMLQAEMDPILKSIGYVEGSVGARMTALAEDPRYHFSNGDVGRKEIMEFIQTKLDEIRGLMPKAFETQVAGFLEVTRIPPEVEDGAPGAYGGPGSVDGKQPGHFWINLRTPALHTKYSLPDLTYHEAIPGHVWQGEYTFKQPLVRSLTAFNAYSEGWALYAEQLADELGVYDDFPVGRLGYLQSLAFRACRLVVDTGIHHKRWTREQAINWFVTNNGSNPDEVQSEVDRYCAWPGQACGYKVGHSEINRLREKAKAALGDKFDFRRFNDAIVLGGSVPMTVLSQVVDRYIKRESRA